MNVIESADYEETRVRLASDPIVVAMAHGILRVPLSELAHESRTPRFEFMLAANREYRARGGTDGGHVGAIAETLIRLREELRAQRYES